MPRGGAPQRVIFDTQDMLMAPEVRARSHYIRAENARRARRAAQREAADMCATDDECAYAQLRCGDVAI